MAGFAIGMPRIPSLTTTVPMLAPKVPPERSTETPHQTDIPALIVMFCFLLSNELEQFRGKISVFGLKVVDFFKI